MDTNSGKFRIELELPADDLGVRVLRGLADLLEGRATAPLFEATAPLPQRPSNMDQDVAAGGAVWDLEKVRRDALGGESRVWRPMLRLLAERRDQWVDWKDICAAVNRTPSQMAGALGAAERRCGKPRPYEKRRLGADHQFRMPAAVAEVIDDVLGS